MTVDSLVETKARVTELVYLVCVLDVVAYLVVDHSSGVYQPIVGRSQ